MVYFWVSLIILLTIVEVATVNLTTIWFVASAIIALIVSLFTDNLLIQIGTFTILGIVFLVLTKPFLNKWIHVDKLQNNLERLIGMKGIVTQEITPTIAGEVKVDGKLWTAVSKERLNKGDVVNILQVNSVKLIVEKWED